MNRPLRAILCSVVSTLCLSMGNSAMADCFLRLDGGQGWIMGESTDARHKGEIDILNWSIAESQLGGGPSPVLAGSSVGRVQMQEFRFTARMSKASPILFRFGASGQHLLNAVLTCRKPGKEQPDFLRIRFDDLVVTNFQTGVQATVSSPAAVPSSGMNDGYPVDQIGLSFSRISIEYFPQAADGKFLAPVTGGFDLRTNRVQ